MLLIIALVAFVLALFRVDLGGIDLVIVGWIFITLHLLFGDRVWSPLHRNP